MSLSDEIKDWRLNGQEDYLLNAELIKKTYTETDHEHCVFCWGKFMNKAIAPTEYLNYSNEGYCTKDGKYWICESCFNDFKKLFKWEAITDKDQ